MEPSKSVGRLLDELETEHRSGGVSASTTDLALPHTPASAALSSTASSPSASMVLPPLAPSATMKKAEDGPSKDAPSAGEAGDEQGPAQAGDHAARRRITAAHLAGRGRHHHHRHHHRHHDGSRDKSTAGTSAVGGGEETRMRRSSTLDNVIRRIQQHGRKSRFNQEKAAQVPVERRVVTQRTPLASIAGMHPMQLLAIQMTQRMTPTRLFVAEIMWPLLEIAMPFLFCSTMARITVFVKYRLYKRHMILGMVDHAFWYSDPDLKASVDRKLYTSSLQQTFALLRTSLRLRHVTALVMTIIWCFAIFSNVIGANLERVQCSDVPLQFLTLGLIPVFAAYQALAIYRPEALMMYKWRGSAGIVFDLADNLLFLYWGTTSVLTVLYSDTCNSATVRSLAWTTSMFFFFTVLAILVVSVAMLIILPIHLKALGRWVPAAPRQRRRVPGPGNESTGDVALDSLDKHAGQHSDEDDVQAGVEATRPLSPASAAQQVV